MELALKMPLEDIAKESTGLMIAHVVLLTGFLAYLVIAIHRVYRSSWLVAALKSAAVLVGYMILVSMAIESTSSFRIIAD